MRYSIKEKRRFHFRLTSTAHLTKSEPVFQFRSLGLADDDFLGHRHFQVDGQPSVEPQADVGYGLSRHDKLSVGPEEIVRIQLLGQFVERLGEDKFFSLTVYRLDQPVGNIEILDGLHRYGQKFIPLHRHQKMRLVILFLFQATDDDRQVRLFFFLHLSAQQFQFVHGLPQISPADGLEQIGHTVHLKGAQGIFIVGRSKDDGARNVYLRTDVEG